MLIQIPSGDWIDPEHVLSIEQSGDTVTVYFSGDVEVIFMEDSTSEAKDSRDAIAKLVNKYVCPPVIDNSKESNTDNWTGLTLNGPLVIGGGANSAGTV